MSIGTYILIDNKCYIVQRLFTILIDYINKRSLVDDEIECKYIFIIVDFLLKQLCSNALFIKMNWKDGEHVVILFFSPPLW